MEFLDKDNKFTTKMFEVPKSKARGERSILIEEFTKELNKLAGTKYKVGETWKVVKEVKPSFVAFKLSHLNVGDLYYFLSTCRQSKSGFSKCFFGALKSR